MEVRDFFMSDPRFDVAFEKANVVLNRLDYDGTSMVSSDAVKKVIEELTGIHILIGSLPFSEIDKAVSNNVRHCGAMLAVYKDKGGAKRAKIVLNDERDARFQRFSLFHEFGHLVTQSYEDLDCGRYRVSTHINYDISSIPQEDYDEDPHLVLEQRANIFALETLMPEKTFVEKRLEFLDVKSVESFFGVTSEAIQSRAALLRAS